MAVNTQGGCLVAHRGYALRYPENSLCGLKAAVAAGARWLEFDIQLTADGVPVLLHDADLQRTAGDSRSVFELTWSELRHVCIGEPDRFANRFEDEYACSLAEVLDWLASCGDVRTFVELKEESIQHFGIRTCLDRLLPLLETLHARCVLISYDASLLAAARDAHWRRIGWVLRACDEVHRLQACALRPDVLFSNWKRLPQDLSLWQGDWDWAVYEVADAEQVLDLAANGVRFIETMQIGELCADTRLRALCAGVS